MGSTTWLKRAVQGTSVLVGIGLLSGSAYPQTKPTDPVAENGLVKSFDDDFDGGAIDGAKWDRGGSGDTIAGTTMWSNAERQVYFSRGMLGLDIEPMAMKDGALRITALPLTPDARSRVLAGVEAMGSDPRYAPLKELAYSSGRLLTRGKFSQTYGYFEARVRYSDGRGVWPAFWLLPADGSWPPEIDILESLGHEPSVVYSTVHSAAMPNQETKTTLTPTEDGYHRYGVLWNAKTIDYYIDGVKVGTAQTPSDAHKPMFMILNLAVGGYWPGYPDAGTKFPATMDVDYVRAWKYR